MALLPDQTSRHREETLDLPDDRALRLVVVSDTHSSPHPRASELIAREAPDAVLHAGDIGDLAVLDQLGTLAPRVIAVRGNIDAVTPELSEIVHIRVRAGGAPFVNLLLLHIAVYGPKLRRDAWRLADAYRARMVVCGHSHVPLILQDRGVGVFNPGSIGPRRFQLPITFGVCEIGPEHGIRCRHVDCETGEPWRPPAF